MSTIALCAIVKEEDSYLEEWVAFHLSIGVDFILIIDNGYRETSSRVLSKYIALGLVEVRTFPTRKKPQQGAYDRAIRLLEGHYTWVGFLDIDEFVFPVAEQDLKRVLAKYERYPALAINWVSFGSGGHLTKPQGWVTENFTSRGELQHFLPLEKYLIDKSGSKPRYHPMNSHVKCFVQPDKTLYFRSAHHFRFIDGGAAVTEKEEPIDGPYSPTVSVSEIRINHYWSKSIEELKSKLAKGRVSQTHRVVDAGYDLEEALAREAASSGIIDTEIAKFLPAARRFAGTVSQHRPDKSPCVRRLRFSALNYLTSESRKILKTLRHFARRLKRLNSDQL